MTRNVPAKGGRSSSTAGPRSPRRLLLRCVTSQQTGVLRLKRWLVTAFAADAAREDRRATASVQRAIALADEEGFRRPFTLFDRERMSRLVSRAITPNAPGTSFANQILADLSVRCWSDGYRVGRTAHRPGADGARAPAEHVQQRRDRRGDVRLRQHDQGTLKSLYRKLEVSSRRAAVRRARELNLFARSAEATVGSELGQAVTPLAEHVLQLASCLHAGATTRAADDGGSSPMAVAAAISMIIMVEGVPRAEPVFIYPAAPPSGSVRECAVFAAYLARLLIRSTSMPRRLQNSSAAKSSGSPSAPTITLWRGVTLASRPARADRTAGPIRPWTTIRTQNPVTAGRSHVAQSSHFDEFEPEIL